VFFHHQLIVSIDSSFFVYAHPLIATWEPFKWDFGRVLKWSECVGASETAACALTNSSQAAVKRRKNAPHKHTDRQTERRNREIEREREMQKRSLRILILSNLVSASNEYSSLARNASFVLGLMKVEPFSLRRF
jgi:hypothetical protein